MAARDHLDLTTASDAVLVVAISRYRQDVLAEAYRRHAGAVFALARRLLFDAAIAEEIVQEVFLRLWNGPEKFDPERGSLCSYLLAQCHGRSVDQLRSDTSRRPPEVLAFQAGGEVAALAITEEVAGGVSESENPPALLGRFA